MPIPCHVQATRRSRALRICITVTLIASAFPMSRRAHAGLAARSAVPGQLVLQNNGARAMQVEVRAGMNMDCSANSLLGKRSVPPKRTWSISTPRPLCWRSGVAAALTGEPTWSAWQRATLAEGERVVKSLAP